MGLQDFIANADKKGVNKFFVFYKDEEGNIQNICYQNYIFFRLEEKRSLRFLNPLRVIDTLEKIRKRELKVIGLGQYVKNVDFNKHYNRKGVNRSWKL